MAVDPGVLDTALARDYFRSEVCCATQTQPFYVQGTPEVQEWTAIEYMVTQQQPMPLTT